MAGYAENSTVSKKADGNLHKAEKNTDVITLDNALSGERVMIVSLGDNDKVSKRLLSMGFIPGNELILLRKRKNGALVHIHGMRAALGGNVTKRISVRLIAERGKGECEGRIRKFRFGGREEHRDKINIIQSKSNLLSDNARQRTHGEKD